MSTLTMDGKRYALMLMGGAAVLSKHIEELNALNVFPVSDGDTGTNMSRTIEGGLARAAMETEDLGEFSKSFSKGALLSARGNSGVILSQIFAGINEALEGSKSVDAVALAQAYKNGISKSYAAVQNPTEGTILTVFRESAEYAAGHVDELSPIEDFYKLLLEKAEVSLSETTRILPVLAEADVVDSGAAGYLYITKGMYGALTGEIAPESSAPVAANKQAEPDIDLFTRYSVAEFGYCTEFLLRLTVNKVDPDSFDIQTILTDLEALHGESVVAYKTDDIIKVHVHTHTPGLILNKMQDYGEFLTVKVENMSLGHSESLSLKKKSKKPYAVVAVSGGREMGARFKQMGADEIISGGQSSNPSIQEFVDAFKRCESDNILVLPNNKNIILAAQQAAKLYTDANVRVIETENLMQGYGALSVITPGISDVDTLCEGALRAAKGVKCVEITRAVRNAHVEGFDIKTGQYLAIGDSGICCVADTPEHAIYGMLKTEDMDLSEIITVFTGADAKQDNFKELQDTISEICPDCEVKLERGGQEIYDYLIAIE